MFIEFSASNILNVRLESHEGMKKEMVNTQFSGLKLRFVLVSVCVLLTVALYAMYEQNILTDCKFSFHFLFSSFNLVSNVYC